MEEQLDFLDVVYIGKRVIRDWPKGARPVELSDIVMVIGTLEGIGCLDRNQIRTLLSGG